MATIDLQVILNGIPLLLTIAVAVMLIVIVVVRLTSHVRPRYKNLFSGDVDGAKIR